MAAAKLFAHLLWESALHMLSHRGCVMSVRIEEEWSVFHLFINYTKE